MSPHEPKNTGRVAVALGERSYDILVGEGLLARAGALMGPVLRRRRVVVVTDEAVAALHLETLAGALDAAGIASERIVVPPGEATKSVDTAMRVAERMLDHGVDRSTAVVALGGGVVGDLAGFAAAITLRGLDFVQVPTTLLAQVDSSVGGKTGVNTGHGKNLIGAFHQPRLVLADTGALRTLPRRELLAGYAEVVKYGLIDRPGFFERLEAHGADLVAGDTALLREAVTTSCEAKAAIVARDERETGDRALLNLGHTFGHALEAEAGYGGDLLHGEGVAIGMTLAFDLSVRLGLCPAADADRVRAHLAAVGLPTSPAGGGNRAATTTARLIERMRRDKKAKDGRIAFVLVRGIGRAFVADDVPLETVAALLDEALAQ
jgi:3-dehydroquinate synthase